VTKDQKIDAFAMRLDGRSLAEIGGKYGLSRQRIQQILPPSGEHERISSTARIRFPKIREWAFSSGTSGSEIIKRLAGEDKGLANHYRSVLYTGAVTATLADVCAIMRATGLSFENAFTEADANAQ